MNKQMDERKDERGHGWRPCGAFGRSQKSFIIFGYGDLTISKSITKSNLFLTTNLKFIGNLLQPLSDPMPTDVPFS